MPSEGGRRREKEKQSWGREGEGEAEPYLHSVDLIDQIHLRDITRSHGGPADLPLNQIPF